MDIHAARKIAQMIARPYARRFSLDSEEAEQVAWIAAWLACISHDPARAKLSTWIGKRVRHALADWRRNTSEWGQGSPVVGCARTGRFAAVTADERLGALLADERGSARVGCRGRRRRSRSDHAPGVWR